MSHFTFLQPCINSRADPACSGNDLMMTSQQSMTREKECDTLHVEWERKEYQREKRHKKRLKRGGPRPSGGLSIWSSLLLLQTHSVMPQTGASVPSQSAYSSFRLCFYMWRHMTGGASLKQHAGLQPGLGTSQWPALGLHMGTVLQRSKITQRVTNGFNCS